MSYNIGNLKSDLQAILHVADLSKISGPDPLIERAARDVLADCDPYETVREQSIATPIHRGAVYYPAPSDLKGDGVLDIYKQGGQSDDGTFFQLRTALDARVYNTDKTYAVEKINGTHYLRANRDTQNYIILDNANTVSDYTATSNISNIAKDQLNYIDGGASISFDLNQVGSATTAVLTAAIATKDLTNYVSEGSVFLWVYMPTASGITSLSLKLGSDSSNYWLASATVSHSGVAFENGWNLIRFDLSSSTETGTVDIDAVDYYALTVSYNGTLQEKFRIDYLTVSLGEIHKIKYYSKFMFRNSSGTWLDTISGDTDLLNLDVDSYNLMLYKSASYFLQHQHDFNYKPNASESDRFEVQYRNALAVYKRRYKTERQNQIVKYY